MMDKEEALKLVDENGVLTKESRADAIKAGLEKAKEWARLNPYNLDLYYDRAKHGFIATEIAIRQHEVTKAMMVGLDEEAILSILKTPPIKERTPANKAGVINLEKLAHEISEASKVNVEEIRAEVIEELCWIDEDGKTAGLKLAGNKLYEFLKSSKES
jgi:hypothetical protein